MNKFTFITLILVGATMAACGGAPSESQTGTLSPQNGNTTANMEISEQSRLIIGTLKLEETDQAVSTEQAAELLPLWEVYQNLSSSDTAAQEEIDGLFAQIQDTMTAEQLEAIEGMALKPEDLFSIMQEQGGAFNNGQGLSTDQMATAQALRNAAGGFGGGGGGGGMPPMGEGSGGRGFVIVEGEGPGGAGQSFSGGDINPEQMATMEARRASGGGFLSGTPAPLINAVIEFLEKKANS